LLGNLLDQMLFFFVQIFIVHHDTQKKRMTAPPWQPYTTPTMKQTECPKLDSHKKFTLLCFAKLSHSLAKCVEL